MRRCYRWAYGNQLFDAALIPCTKFLHHGRIDTDILGRNTFGYHGIREGYCEPYADRSR